MQTAIFNTPVIKVESLKNKFDTLVLSGSFINLIGDYAEAHFFQQLHYWSLSEYGVVIDGVRWIYKPLREWLSEVFTFLTEWKLRKAIASLLEKGLIERKKLYVKHHEIKHNNPYWNPKNQTYYYSVNYEKLQELIDEVENKQNAGSTENVRIEDSTILSSEDFQDTKCCELSQNNTDLTSIENNSIDQSHPHLPCEWKEKNQENNQKVNLGNRQVVQQEQINSLDSTVIEPDTNVGQVEDKINQNTSTNKVVVDESLGEVKGEREKGKGSSYNSDVLKPKLKKTPKGTKQKRESKAPWKSEGQFKRFYRALIQALPIVANARSPQGLAQTIIRQLRAGIPHSYWDDFAAGLPIGMSDKPEWEIEPGVPYPMFIEYLTEKLKAGNNTKTDEQTRNEVFRILEKPRQAKAFWGQFKRSIVNVSEQVERDRALGVSSPSTPVWTRERIEPSIEEAAEAGQKITAVNDATQAVLKSTRTPQLESKDSSSASQMKSNEVSPADPWIGDRPTDTECDRPQPTMREMLEARGVKGFCPKGYPHSRATEGSACGASRSAYKPMPKISQAELEAEKRKQTKPKTNIAQMSLAEINEYLTDPILRAQLTPQLINSDYELITDYLGQIIGVELSELQKREKRRLERE